MKQVEILALSSQQRWEHAFSNAFATYSTREGRHTVTNARIRKGGVCWALPGWRINVLVWYASYHLKKWILSTWKCTPPSSPSSLWELIWTLRAEMLYRLQVACHTSLHSAKNHSRKPGLFQIHTAGEFQVQPEWWFHPKDSPLWVPMTLLFISHKLRHEEVTWLSHTHKTNSEHLYQGC